MAARRVKHFLTSTECPPRDTPAKMVDWNVSWDAVVGKAREVWTVMISAWTWDLDGRLMQARLDFVQDVWERRMQRMPCVQVDFFCLCRHLDARRKREASRMEIVATLVVHLSYMKNASGDSPRGDLRHSPNDESSYFCCKFCESSFIWCIVLCGSPARFSKAFLGERTTN